jgi:hypothetical protein
MPGIDQLAVDRGLPADGFETGAVEERREQGVSRQRLIEPGDGAGGARQRAEQVWSDREGQFCWGVEKSWSSGCVWQIDRYL